jgi:predicted nucleic acid-binding protein
VIYLDTSALIKLYLLEEGSEQVHSLISGQEDPLPIWELQEAELINALRLKVFWKDIQPVDAEEQITLFQERKKAGFYFFPEMDRIALMERYRELSVHTMELGCRTMDILHVACAVQIQPEVFVSFDSRQRTLAERAGLPIHQVKSTP